MPPLGLGKKEWVSPTCRARCHRIGGRNAGRSSRQNSDRLICFPVSEESNRNENRHDPGNGANDYWLHERRLKSKKTLNCRTQSIRQALQIILQQEPRMKSYFSTDYTFFTSI